MRSGGLKRRLGRTFVLQAAAISIATVLGIVLAGLVLEQVLITQALKQEAEHFWQRYRADPGFPGPDTHNLSGYLARGGNEDGVPAAMRGLAVGFHDRSDDRDFSTVFVSERGDDRLYLVFDGEQVSALATWFGVIPLAIVLLVLYLSVWVAYRVSQRAVSPITSLADKVNQLDLDAPNPTVFTLDDAPGTDDEVVVLSSALAGFAERLAAFVERERLFTRDASHELRTPLTVIGIACEVLLARPDLADGARRDVQRIARSTRDMTELVEAFLLLARETEGGLEMEDVSINAVLAEEIERARLVGRDKPVRLSLDAKCSLALRAPRRVPAILLGNLVKNAVSYTESGEVRVTIDADGVLIEDSGIGMAAEELEHAFEPFFRGSSTEPGHGVGLSIVRRLSDRFCWPVRIHSQPGVGTRVRVHFGDAVVQPVDGASSRDLHTPSTRT